MTKIIRTFACEAALTSYLLPLITYLKKVLTKDQLNDIREAVDVVRRGGLILYPTDTIWGIGCDATNPEAVARVYALKHRADAKALICLLGSDASLGLYVSDVPPVAYDLIDCADRPLTIIYDGARHLAPNLLAEDGSVGIRITREEFSQTLCMRCKRALVSTSANISGAPSPQRFADISPEIIAAVDYVCTSRRTETAPGRPSSILKLSASSEIKIIRE